MATPQEIEKRKKALEAQLLGGVVKPSGVYYDEAGNPNIAITPGYYNPKVLPTGYNLSIAGVNTKEALATELARLRLEQEKLNVQAAPQLYPDFDEKKRGEELLQQVRQDYLESPMTAPESFSQSPRERLPGTKVLGTPVEAAPALNVAAPEGYVPTWSTAMRPQSYKATMATTEVDWDSIVSTLEGDGIDRTSALSQVEGLKVIYDAYIDAGVPPQEAWKQSVDTIQTIGSAPSLKDTERFREGGSADPYIRAFELQVDGAQDIPDYNPEQMKFMKAAIRTQKKANYDDLYNEVTTTDVPYVRVSGFDGRGTAIDLPKEVVDFIRKTNRNVTEPIISQRMDNQIRDAASVSDLPKRTASKTGEIEALIQVKGINKFGDDNAWFLDPDKKNRVLENPEAYIDEGFFTDISPFGGTAETTKAWTIRAALSPFNVVAGYAQPALEMAVGVPIGAAFEAAEAMELIPEDNYYYTAVGATSESLRAQREKQRAETQPLYADSPVLANIALNKGFTGEAQDLADALSIKDGWGTAMVVGGFMLDIADPSPGLAIGMSKGVKAGAQMRKAQKVMLGSTDWKQIAKVTAEEGTRAFLNDLNGISSIARKRGWVDEFAKAPAGDVRLHISNRMEDSLDVRHQARQVTKNGGNVDDLRNIVGDLDATDYGKLLQEQVDAGKSLEDALKAADDFTPATKTDAMKLFDETQDQLDFIEDVARMGDDADLVKVSDIENVAPNLPTLAREFDDISKAVYGKRVADLTAKEVGNLRPLFTKNTARRLTFDALPDLAVADDVVALTRKTWAHPESAAKLQAEANKTPLGKFVAQVASGQKKLMKQFPTLFDETITLGDDVVQDLKPTPHYIGTKQVADNNYDAITYIRNNTSLPQATKERIIRSIQEDQLSFQDFRILIDANVDAVALRLQEDLGMATLRDIDNLDDFAQQRLLDAEGRRTQGFIGETGSWLNREVLKPALAKFTKSELPSTGTTFQQKRMVSEVMNDASSMDLRLQADVESLMRSPEMRQAYGLDPDIQLTREQALGVAIVGPKDEAFRLLDPTGANVMSAEDWLAAKRQMDADYGRAQAAEQQRVATNKAEKAERTRVAREKFSETEGIAEANYKEAMDEAKQAKANAKAKARDEARDYRQRIDRSLEVRKAQMEAQARAANPTDAAARRSALKDIREATAEAKQNYRKTERETLQRKLNEADAEFEVTKRREDLFLQDVLDDAETILVDELDAIQRGLQPRPVPREFMGAEWTASSGTQQFQLAKTGEWALQRIYFEAKKGPVFIDRATGANQFFKNDLLNAKGQELLDEKLEKFALVSMESPENYWGNFQQLTRDYEAILSNPLNIRAGVNPDFVALGKAAEINKRSSNLNVGMFYYAEGNRIINRHLLKAVNDDALSYSIKDIIGSDSYLRAAFTGVDVENLEPLFQSAVRQQTIERLNNARPSSWKAHLGWVNEVAKQNPRYQAIAQRLASAQTEQAYWTMIGQASQNTTTREFIDTASRLTRRTNETADTILKNNELQFAQGMDYEDLNRIMDGVFGTGNEAFGRGLLGADTYDALRQQFITGRTGKQGQQIDEMFRTEMVGDKMANTAKSMFGGVGPFFYFGVLATRAKFYINNYLTAPFISYASVGDTTAGSLADGRKVAFTRPGDPTYYEIAVTDPYGRAYTYGELHEVLYSGGLRSEAGFISQGIRDGSIARYVADKKLVGVNGTQFLADPRQVEFALNNLTMREDARFRAATMINDLKSGKSIEEAQMTARRSLFDYNSMSDFEKSKVASVLVFYSFWRENFVTFLDAMGDASKMKRYLNIAKTKRGVEGILEQHQKNQGTNWDPNVFMNNYSQGKIRLWKRDYYGKNYSLYLQTPSIPALDAMSTFGQFMSAPVGTAYEEGAKMLQPGYKALTYAMFPGAASGFDKIEKRVPDNLVAQVRLFAGDDPNAIAYWLELGSGSPIRPIPVSEGGVGGYIYPLDEKQAQTFTQRFGVLSRTGAMAPTTEWTRLLGLGPEEGAMTLSSPAERLLFSPSKVYDQQTQTTFQLSDRKKLLEQLIREKKGELYKEQRTLRDEEK